MVEERLLEASEVARLAGVSADTVRRAADVGDLPVAEMTTRRTRLFRRIPDVEQWLETRRARLEHIQAARAARQGCVD
jgi:excisionase family DNA binding protein